MSSLEESFEAAVKVGDIPGAVLLAAGKDNFSYARAFGTRSLRDPNSKPPMAMDTVMWMASTTKLLTSIAAMQCVERGLVELDVDVRTLLPELQGIQVLKSFTEAGEPMLEKAESPLTLRHLLTHSAGFCYDLMSPLLAQWRAYNKQPVPRPGPRITDRYLDPLIFEPGTAWSYGTGVDWAGKVIERVNGGVPLEEYMKANVFAPLGIKDMTFYLQRRSDLIAKRADISKRDPENPQGVLAFEDAAYWHDRPADGFGGQGLFSTPEEYIKILHSLLFDDGKLLKPETAELLFSPQLSGTSEAAFTATLANDMMNEMMGSLMPLGLKKNHTLGGMLLQEDIPGTPWRRAGTLAWSGMPSIYWFVDRDAGLCGLYASQVLPLGDPKTIKMARLFEQTMYERIGATSNVKKSD